MLDGLAEDVDGGFEAMVREYASVVYSSALRLVGSPADAEELAQETFLRAYSALRRYPAERIRELRCRAWLLAITVNLWRNHVRRAIRRPPTRPLEPGIDPVDGSDGPEQLAIRADDRERLAALVAQLPERHRLPVVLRHVAGLSYAELATVLGCPVGTAKARVSRGARALRDLMSHRWEEVSR